MLQKLFDLLQKSTIASREIADPKQRFWKTYRTVAEAFDNEFLAKYGSDMDMSMIFVSQLLVCLGQISDILPGWSFLRRLRYIPYDDEARLGSRSECCHSGSSSNPRHLAQCLHCICPIGLHRTRLDRPKRDHRLGPMLAVHQLVLQLVRSACRGAGQAMA